MTPIHSSFRSSISQALSLLGVNFRYFRDECVYDEFLQEVDALTDASAIALLALTRLCDGSQRTIDKAVMVAVVEYLDSNLRPDPKQPKEARLRALLKKYPSDEYGYADWINVWYG